MSGFVADEGITVALTQKRCLGVGHQRCIKCQKPTPRPPISVVEEIAENFPGQNFVWPFGDWWPEGWIEIRVNTAESSKYMCGACTDAMLRKADVAW